MPIFKDLQAVVPASNEAALPVPVAPIEAVADGDRTQELADYLFALAPATVDYKDRPAYLPGWN